MPDYYDEAPICKIHNCNMQLIDTDPDYDHQMWECPIDGCFQRANIGSGPSEHQILRRENP